MRITQVNSTVKTTIASNPSLSSYLRKLAIGRPGTPHSWLYENETSEKTLHTWIPKMESALRKNSDLAEVFIQFDRKQIEKFGQQGVIPPVFSEEAQSVLEPLFSPTVFDDPEALSQYYTLARDFAVELFGSRLRTKRPRAFQTVIKSMRTRGTLNTNSGYPRFKKRDSVYGMEIADAISGAAFDYPAVVLFRSHNGKLRPVWMYPMSMNLLEFTFSHVIQDEMRKSSAQWIRDYLSPWEGYNKVKETLTLQWVNEETICGGDTDKMDAHMRPAQIRLVFEIVKWLFQPAYWETLWRTMERVNTIPLLCSPTKWIVGTHGLASGAGFTQLTETVVQLFMAWLKRVKGQGIGDDFYWLWNASAEDVVEYLASFGLPANVDKQSVSNVELPFLQRLNHQGFFSRDNPAVLGGYYPTIRALNSSLNPEKFHNPKFWNVDMFCSRQYMILENCVDDPCFDEFLKFVVKGHKALIPFAQKQASDLDAIQKTSRLVPGLNPSYNQEKMDKPLSEYTSIRLAKAL